MIFLTVDPTSPDVTGEGQIDERHMKMLKSIPGVKVYLSLEELVQEIGLSFYAAIEASDDIDIQLTTFDITEAEAYQDKYVEEAVEDWFTEVDYENWPALSQMDTWEKFREIRQSDDEQQAMLVVQITIGGPGTQE